MGSLFGDRQPAKQPDWTSGASMPSTGLVGKLASAFNRLFDAASRDQHAAMDFNRKFIINASKAEEALKRMQPELSQRELAVKDALGKLKSATGHARERAEREIAVRMGRLKDLEMRYDAQYQVFEFNTVIADKLTVFMPLEGSAPLKETTRAMGIVERMFERFMSTKDEVDILVDVLGECGVGASGAVTHGSNPLLAEAMARFVTPDSGFTERNPNIVSLKRKAIGT